MCMQGVRATGCSKASEHPTQRNAASRPETGLKDANNEVTTERGEVAAPGGLAALCGICFCLASGEGGEGTSGHAEPPWCAYQRGSKGSEERTARCRSARKMSLRLLSVWNTAAMDEERAGRVVRANRALLNAIDGASSASQVRMLGKVSGRHCR